MAKSTTDYPIVDDDAITKIAARPIRAIQMGTPLIELTLAERDALCQTVRALRAETAICKGEITAADPGKWGHESKIRLLLSQLEQVTKERDDYRRRLKEWEL